MVYKGFGKTVFVLGILLLGEWNRGVHSVSTQEDITLTRKEKEALDHFRKRVSRIVPHDYMKRDIYLIRWLRAKNLDLNQAETMLRENLKWREDNKLDTILEEDFTELDRDYPYQIRFHDKEGKPIATANFGDWNIRQAVISGKLQALHRHIERGFENATRTVRQLQDEGKVVTQSDFIINMENYNMLEQGCLQCLPFYFHLVNTYETYYPGTVDLIITINTPAIFEMVLNAMKPLMSPRTRQTLQIYNTNKEQWQSKLLKIVDRDELPIEYGGTKEV